MNVSCPLCSALFSEKDIQQHASYCNGVSTEKAAPSLKRSFNEVDSKVAPLFSKRVKVLGSSSVEVSKEFSTERVMPAKPSAPLAERMRPNKVDTFSGQDNAMGPDGIIRTILDSGQQIPSLILWGPPGCGKTTIANIIAKSVKTSIKFVKMSACTCGVSEVRDVVKQAKNDLSMFRKKTLLFMDEVHRFNKTQQDSFLPHIESGTIIFLGATTENPSYSLNNALLSRCKVISLEKLDENVMNKILRRALEHENVVIGVSGPGVSISEDALSWLSGITDGDARAALNNLELVLNGVKADSHLSLDDVTKAVTRASVVYDKKGDQHYHMASALQKSIRGSDANAALYWLGRMLRGGEDPSFIARRLIVCASEDIGLGDSGALPLAVAAMQGSQLVGRPECDKLLAHCAVYLARAPKSHEVYHALGEVYRCIDNPGPSGLPGVPLHLRTGGGKMGRDLGWGEGYTHDLNQVKNIQYMPETLKDKQFLYK